MGFFDWLFRNNKEPKIDYKTGYDIFTGYQPRFTTRNGGLYETQLVRAAIHARATHISKLAVQFVGTAEPTMRNRMAKGPNEVQTWSQFLYRLSTILDIYNTAFILPVHDELGRTSGVYAPVPEDSKIIFVKDIPYLRYKFSDGKMSSIRVSDCGVMNKFQYRNEYYGESNQALLPTMDLINIQNQGIEEGVKSAATYRFMAQLANFSKAEDLAKERKRFTAENFSRDAEAGGLLLFPNTYQNIKQIDVKPWVVDADQMEQINKNVFEYFGVNENILQNKVYGNEWSAFYEGAIEPFAIQFSEVMTKMLYSDPERSEGNQVMATSNRLQYMSNADKLNVSAQLLDRGIISINDAREIWNLPPVDGGDARVIRGEYYNADEKVGEDNGDEGDS